MALPFSRGAKTGPVVFHHESAQTFSDRTAGGMVCEIVLSAGRAARMTGLKAFIMWPGHR